METTLPRTTLSNDFATIRRVSEWIGEAFLNYRNRGLRSPAAIEQAAMDFGVTPRAVRAFLYGEASAVPRDKWRAIKVRFVAHLASEQEALMRRSQALKEREMELRREIENEQPGMHL